MTNGNPTGGTLNDQVRDAVEQINTLVGGSSDALLGAMTDQIMAQAIGLAMQNAVAQQQQNYILRNAVITAAAQAILAASPEQALDFAREVCAGEDIALTLERLGKLQRKAAGGKTPDGG